MRITKTLATAFLVTASLIAITASAQARTGSGSFFQRADTNQDGVVSRAEFEASRDERFQLLDKNHDGVISQADFTADQSGSGHRGTRMLERLDANGDGSVSHDEFVAGSMDRFDNADANHDGNITQDEASALRGHYGGADHQQN